jgi:serine/threonine protein kinase
MRQCNACYRFLAHDCPRCPYCGITAHTLLALPGKGDHADYRIAVSAVPIAGRTYRLDGLIDRGGYGTVLQVTDEAGCRYALKVSLAFDKYFTNHTGFSTAEIQQSSHYLYAEIKALSKLEMDLKLRIFYAGAITMATPDEELSFPGILMELAEYNLAHIIHGEARKQLTVPFEEKVKIIADVLHSLTGIHNAHLLHRDLSPDNIFAIARDGEIRYIISDFGSAKFGVDTTDALKMSSRIAAHDYYIDPERRYNASFRYDVRSDIWSAGVIIGEVLIGNFWANIIDRQDALNVARLDFETDVFDTYFKALLDRPLYKILRRAVKRVPAARYPRVTDLSDSLLHYLTCMSPRALHNQSARNTIRLDISIEANLPLNLDDPDQGVYTYTGSHKIAWDTFGNWRIVFPDLHIEAASLSGTRLFTAQAEHNTVDLHINHAHIRAAYRGYEPVLTTARGCMLFAFQLTVEYSEARA